MPINDRRIDLTEDNKFCQTERVSWFGRHEKEVSFPWNPSISGLTSDTQLQDPRPKRLWGDSLSDEMGYVVRRGSDNRWWFGDYTDYKKYYFWQMFDEILYEVSLIKPLYCVCPRCGKRQITNNIFYDECDECKLDMECEKTKQHLFPNIKKTNYIAWNDAMPHQNILGYRTPFNILQQLLYT